MFLCLQDVFFLPQDANKSYTFLLNAIYNDLSILLFEYILGEKKTLMQARWLLSNHFLYSLSFCRGFVEIHSIQGYFKT